MAELRRITITPAQRSGDQVTLNAAQCHYLQRVLRLGAGDHLIIADGQGQTWEALLGTEATEAQLLQAIDEASELKTPLILVAAIPKGNGFDEVVRQVTELGVTAIVPVLSARTVLEPSAKRVDRWRRIATEAFEQCERQRIPLICEPQAWGTFLRACDDADEAMRLYPELAQGLDLAQTDRAIAVARSSLVTDGQDGGATLLSWLTVCQRRSEYDSAGRLIAIGPEGGWTSAEVNQAIMANFRPVSLGDRVLRAVTASVVAVAIGSMTDSMP